MVMTSITTPTRENLVSLVLRKVKTGNGLIFSHEEERKENFLEIEP